MVANLESKKFLKVLYTIFLAALIALFFGLGVAAFYPQPKAPEYPVALEKPEPSSLDKEQRAQEEKYQKEQKDYLPKIQEYNRNVSMIILGSAILTLVASLLLAGKVEIMPDGLMLGSIFLLVYSIGRGFATEDARYRFVITTIGLLVTLGIGYLKFLRKEDVEG